MPGAVMRAFADEAENSAQTSGAARDKSVDAAEQARQHKGLHLRQQPARKNAANSALSGHENSAAEYADRLKASQDTRRRQCGNRNSRGMKRNG